MTLIVVTDCPPVLKGILSRFLFEIHTGVYAGNPGQRIRERLWEKIRETIQSGRAVLVFSSRCEQGFEIRTLNSALSVQDLDGIQLMIHPGFEAAISDPSESFQSASVFPFEELHLSQEKSSACQLLPSDFIVLDLETTGLDPQKDGITEIGALKVQSGQITDQFQALIRTSFPLPEKISKLTGITRKLLQEQGQDEKQVLESFSQFCNENLLVCHNATFDLQFLHKAFDRQKIPFQSFEVIDTLFLARQKLPGLPGYRLKALLEYFQIDEPQRHRALEDCKLILKVFEKLNKIG